MTWPLVGKVALVAGATRGAGRGIAVALGEAGATVYCTGRSTRERRSEYDRPETIEETAELVEGCRRHGIAVPVDHLEPEQVEALVGESTPGRAGSTSWSTTSGARSTCSSGTRRCGSTTSTKGLRHAPPGDRHPPDHQPLCAAAADPRARRPRGRDDRRHARVQRRALPGLGVLRPGEDRACSGSRSRRARSSAPHGCTAVALTPGWLRSEMMLENYGVTEANWRDAGRRRRTSRISESPRFVGRAVAALAADPDVQRRNGRVVLVGRARPGLRLHRSRRLTAGLLALHRRGPGARAARRTTPATAMDGARWGETAGHRPRAGTNTVGSAPTTSTTSTPAPTSRASSAR